MKKNLGKIVSVLCILLVMGMTVCAADVENIKKNRVFQTGSEVELHEAPDAASAVTGTLPGATPVIVKEDAKDGWCKVAYQETEGYVQVSSLVLLGSQSTPGVSAGQDTTASDVQSSVGTVQGNDAQSSVGTVQGNDAQSSAGEGQENGTGNDAQVSAGAQDVSVDINTLNEEFKNVQEENLLSFQEAEAAKEQQREQKKADIMWKVIIAVLVVAIFAVGIVTTLVGNKGKKKKQ